jgi:hypothetical protein
MRSILPASFSMLLVLGCHHDSPKVARQKAIYFSITGMARNDEEIIRTMEREHLPTPGLAMVLILDQCIAQLPQVNAIVAKGAAKAGIVLPPPDPLDQAEERIKTARTIRDMVQARAQIIQLEQEATQ